MKYGRDPDIPRAQIERVCRVYHTDNDAARALGVSAERLRTFAKKYNVRRPSQRGKEQP